MPDDTGQLSKEEIAQAKQWLAEHWKADSLCPICNSNDWNVGDRITVSLAFTGKRLVSTGKVNPHVLVTCMTCGNVLQFNALLMGILPEDPEGEGVDAAPLKEQAGRQDG
jgi:hypothetical protein